MTQATTLPPPPRALTPAASRRAWMEPRVRAWWLGGVVLLLIAIGLGYEQVATHLRESRLISTGTPVDAKVESANGGAQVTGTVPPDSVVNLSFTLNGQPYDVTGTLGGRKDFIPLKGIVPIRVDPNNPASWTARTEPAPLGPELLPIWIVLPLVIGCAIGAILARASVVSVYRDGTAQPFTVVGSHQTALSPASRAVRCTSPEKWDKRVFTVYVPRAIADPKPGEVIWVYAMPKKSQHALAAVAYG